MVEDNWIWEILVCPECTGPLRRSSSDAKLSCLNPACGYQSDYQGRCLNLLPRHLDRHQIAENDYRLKHLDRFASLFPWMDSQTYQQFKLLNILTYYSFTSQYFFFRDHFVQRYPLQGRGLEIGGSFGQASDFIKFFYPHTQMVASDVAPYNVQMGVALADWLGWQTDYYVMADAERLPFKAASFDFIFSSGMLHHLGNLNQALQQGHQALRPGGRWYIVNELSIGRLPRWYWNSSLGQKGQQARSAGIRENSYTLKEWEDYFGQASFRIVEMEFHRDPKHKMESWPRAAYYALISRLPERLLKLGLPCEVNFVLEKVE